jgi:hypothetical protein
MVVVLLAIMVLMTSLFLELMHVINTGLFSYFGTANYDFDSRFGVTGTIRRDASSRFSQTNRWGTFWSVAGFGILQMRIL